MASLKVQFQNKLGFELSARLEFPLAKKPVAYVVFAHVFTGTKSLSATRHISRALTLNGYAVLRFDFTGLGQSEGDFADTNFTSNVDDIVAAAEFLKENYEAPKIIVGHSLGGAASIFASKKIDSVRAVATIGAPSQPEHVTHLLESNIDQIESQGKANVNIGGKQFTIKKQFLDDLRSKDLFNVIKNLKKALLVMHSPQDHVVEIENAAQIYHAAHHPKSFVTLDHANHMLTNKDDAYYVGNVIASWVKRYIDQEPEEVLKTDKQVLTRLGTEGFTTDILAGKHGLVADESENLGGLDFGPSPYELLNASLGACIAMTLQMYARRKKWDLDEVKVHLSFNKSYHEDCEHCENDNGYLNTFDIELELEGSLDAAQQNRLIQIAHKCPIHKTLKAHKEFNVSLR